MPTCIWHRLLLLPLKISLITETESVDSVMLLFRTNEQIRAEIENKFGFIPPFFSPAQRNPQVLENLWQQTLNAYVSNPLPLLFKEKLSAYLSRFCAVPYCMICHSCSLVPLGMKAREVLELLESPLPTEDEIDKHLRLLATKSNGIDIFLEANSLLEESLLYCSIFIAMERDLDRVRLLVRWLRRKVAESEVQLIQNQRRATMMLQGRLSEEEEEEGEDDAEEKARDSSLSSTPLAALLNLCSQPAMTWRQAQARIETAVQSVVRQMYNGTLDFTT